MQDCGAGIFKAGKVKIEVDESTMRAREPLPACPSCGALARPNILMFGDWGWNEVRTAEQQDRLESWLKSALDDRLVIIELGAGTAVPTVRNFSERIAESAKCNLIRINPRESAVPAGQIGLPLGALAAIEEIDRLLKEC
jgi:NAD-dependent SIR2 family protein deacetylase